MVEQSGLADDSQEAEREEGKGLGSQYHLKRHTPNDLTFSQEAPPLKGSTPNSTADWGVQTFNTGIWGNI